MRQLFLTQFKYRSNPILLSYQNKYHRFTFIQNDFNLILAKNEAKNYTINNRVKLMSADNFLLQLNKQKPHIINAQQNDFKEIDLDKILANNYSNSTSKVINNKNNFSNDPYSNWEQQTPIIRQLSNIFISMTDQISKSLTKNNLHQSILTLTQFNCLQLRIWQRLICFISHYYKQSPLNQRLVMITALSEYMKKFEYSYSTNSYTKNKKPAFKFMYPQSYIIDLVDFRQLFKSLQFQQDFIKQNDSVQDQTSKLTILQSLIYLIMKSTKKADMNIYSVKNYFRKRTKQMITIAQKHKQSQLHSRVLFNIYFIYSYLNYTDNHFYQHLEKHYYEMLANKLKVNNLKSSPLQNNKDGNYHNKNIIQQKQINAQSKEINKLLSIWKLNQRSNQSIYNQLIRPFLINLLNQGIGTMYYSNIAINLLTAGITDTIVFDKIISICSNQGVKDDQFMHMLKHFLNVQNKQLSYKTDYHKCQTFQNPKILKYLSNNHIPVYSQCLHQNITSKNCNDNQNIKLKKKSSQHHKTQRMWSDIVKSLFEPKYEVIQNANICNYEIDCLVLTNKKMYAIQIQGGHYNKKELNFSTNIGQDTQDKVIKSTGKREIRQMILKAYNIQFIKIHCEEKLPTYIMQSRNITAGKKYIAQKIFNETGVRFQDL